MVLKTSSPKSGNLSASDYASDPEKEISDDDDDDRNHKHRRRETHSQSSDKNAVENISARPYRSQNRSSGNGQTFTESKSQNICPVPSEKHFTGKFGKRPFELNQRNRTNQTHLGDLDLGRGRGRGAGSWNHCNNRFTSLDIASQIVPRGTIPPGLFPDRGLPSIPNAQSASWGGYGLMPGIPNGSVETLHSIGLQGAFGPVITSSLGIPRQRCRDFEERGFCLRGDMCPMEHGINRIVVEDVQSLSQFNLPVSLSSGPILGPPAIPGSLPSVGVASTSLMNNKGPRSRNSKHGMADDIFALKSANSESASVAAADLYDPDQPLWNNGGPETPSALVALRSSQVDEGGSLLNDDIFGNKMSNATDIEMRDRTTLPVGSQSMSSSIWGRIGNSKGKTLSRLSGSDNGHNEIAENQEAIGIAPGSSNHGKSVILKDADPKSHDPSRAQSDDMRLARKPTQKALRTLFVNGIPQKNNRRDALLSHFQKYGKVIDIYIPMHSERAFVQFSKREEAEAALKTPDAVMGNRFIKLWWANRDNIADDGMSSIAGVPTGPRGANSSLVPTALSIPSRGKDNLQSGAKAKDVPARDTSVAHADQSKFPVTDNPKVPPTLQKKLELEHLKEELRKKQEMLDQKRSDFKRQLDKFEKQASGVKSEDVAEQVAKKPKVELASDLNRAATLQPSGSSPPTPRPSDGDAVATSCEEKPDNKNFQENAVLGKPDASSLMGPKESTSSLKQTYRPSVPSGMPFSPNRYKLDNRPTTFRILPPLPSELANVAALKTHFSSYGDLTVVELEDTEAHDNPNGSGTTKSFSVRVGFRDRQTAERAFLNSKSWRGHYLQFVWVASTGHVKAITNPGITDNPSSAASEPSESDTRSTDKAARISSEDQENGDRELSQRQRSIDHAEPAEASQPLLHPRYPEEKSAEFSY